MRLSVILAALLAAVAAAGGEPEPLAVEAALSEALADRETAWILTAADGRRWERGFSDQPILPGSLLKPFAALAWLESHSGAPPVTHCRGDRCWLPTGHGELGLTAALAQSCNFYFSALAQSLSYEQVAGVALRFGLATPPTEPPSAWWGGGDGWQLRAPSLLAAYQELGRRRNSPGAALVLGGLRQSAVSGTARGVGLALHSPALAKTGTAPCRHSRRSDADGLAIVLYPASNPRYTMLLQACGRTGRVAAVAVGLALARLTGEPGSAQPQPLGK
jgi:stage II sporulation protein D